MSDSHYQHIKILKNGDSHKLYYENEDRKIEQNISEQHFDKLFSHIQPNFSFSFPDRLVQDIVKDGSMIPSFKNSLQFSKDDFHGILDSIKEKNLLVSRENMRKKVNRNIHNRTKKNVKSLKNSLKEAKEELKSKLLNKYNKNKKPVENKKVNKKQNKRQKTSKKK